MRLVLAGTPDVAVSSLRALLASRHEVAAVLTRPDAGAGRGRSSRPSPVRLAAEEAGVEVLTPRRPSEPDLLARLAEIAPDCVPVVAYGALVPRAALDVPRLGWVNLHFSLLPAWRGAAPVQRAIMAGDELGGASVFRLVEGLDTGPVLATMVERLRPRDTAGEVLQRLGDAGADLLVKAMDGLEDGILEARPQEPDGVSLAPRLTVAEARADFSLPAAVVDRRVRGCTPAPGAWSLFRGSRVKLGPVEPVDALAGSAELLLPGAVVVRDGAVLVGTATAPVRLGRVQPEGKRPMPAADWARGVRPAPGEAFELPGAAVPDDPDRTGGRTSSTFPSSEEGGTP